MTGAGGCLADVWLRWLGEDVVWEQIGTRTTQLSLQICHWILSWIASQAMETGLAEWIRFPWLLTLDPNTKDSDDNGFLD